MKKIVLIFSCISLMVFANPKPKWGEISLEEEKYKICSFEKQADAVILAEKGAMFVDFEGVSTRIFKRIKILNSDGLTHGNVEIKFQAQNNFEEIRNLKAQIFYPENNYSRPITLSEKDFFLKDITSTWKKYEFTFPKLKSGCIIEYQYTLYSKGLAFLDSWEFQHEIPTEYSEFSVEIEDQMSYRPIIQGKKLLEKLKNDKKRHSKWILEDVESYSNIDYTYNIQDYINKISFQLENYGYSGTFVSKWKELLKEVREEYKAYYRSKPLQEELSKVEKSNDSLQYLKNIIQYFSSKYAWNSKNIIGASLSRPQKELINFKKGSRSELNVLLNALIKEAGFKTDLILIGQRHYGRPVITYPSLQQFTGSLSGVFLNGGSYLFDATNLEQYPFGYAPPENYNYLGLIVGKEEKWIELKMLLSEMIQTQYYDFNQNQYSKRTMATGYFIKDQELNDESFINAIDADHWEKYSEEKSEKEGKVKRNQTFSIKDINEIITIYNPLAKKIGEYNFKDENRFAPFEFDFPYVIEARVIIKLSENSKIKNSELFSDKIIQPELGLLYKQEIKEKKNSLTINYKLVFAKTMIASKKKEELETFFRNVQSKLNHQIIIQNN